MEKHGPPPHTRVMMEHGPPPGHGAIRHMVDPEHTPEGMQQLAYVASALRRYRTAPMPFQERERLQASLRFADERQWQHPLMAALGQRLSPLYLPACSASNALIPLPLLEKYSPASAPAPAPARGSAGGAADPLHAVFDLTPSKPPNSASEQRAIIGQTPPRKLNFEVGGG
eukprot:CAMPEP_0182566772 /NCGR_PEP_ID=MMETSP1324-20130603/8143_1 /TAXON_ID=236786 /ORGANISM="Florenciella sp., Strain RCC1587" /LENGTH=170 /DNA_ID=CAMNT_0024780627 /DNA_START=39 /DNA_END=547 /DNA_ORIENTATION=+